MAKPEIRIDTAIREKWHAGHGRPGPPNEIVIHGTGGGGTYKFVLDGGRAQEYKRGVALFHYLIASDGVITEIISPDRWVYHSSSGRHDERTIGIELENKSANNAQAYTDAQYASLFALVFDELMVRYKIKRLVSHNFNGLKFSDQGKACPGKGFDWKLLSEEMKVRGIEAVRNDSEEYIII
jgi:N-acetyl-anhydromuramyl-L-alanine amidase AmpD